MSTLMSLVSTTISTQLPPHLAKPTSSSLSFSLPLSKIFTQSRKRAPYKALRSITENRDLVTAKTIRESISQRDAEEGEEAGFVKEVEREKAEPLDGPEEIDRFVGKAINATIVLGVGSLAITRLLSIDHDFWHGWTLYEVLRYAPEHNWVAYEEALKTNPVLSKMAISGIVYSVGDWIAQCYEGKPLFEFDRTRLFRSGLVGFALHGSLSHYYYQFCEALIPSKEWWVVPAKVAFDQTAWAALWNSIYFVALGFLRLESPANILEELKSTFWPMLTVRNLSDSMLFLFYFFLNFV